MTDFTVATLDRLSKRTSMTIGVADAATNQDLQSVVDAIAAIILGAAPSGTKTVPTVIDAGSSAAPANTNANRLNKWLFRMQDSVNGKIFTHEIGTANNAQLPSPTSDFLDLTAGAGLALKTAIDAVYRSPYGNAGVLVSVQQVSRSGAQ
ncbi:MAG: hypothetical protein FOGNACKC_01403 [Anaerolineae bacterium]|nr:hypothetical protein [Anaerolineae bacterium]